MLRRLSVILAVLAVGLVISVQAQPPVPDASVKPRSAEPSKDNVVREQDRLLREWKQFEGILVRMAQRLDKSSNIEDKARAEGLRKAIDLSNKEGVENRFQKLITTLVASKTLTVDDLQKAAGQNDELIKILRDMLEMLLTDNEALRRREEIAKLTELIKQVDGIIRAEKVTQARIEGNKIDEKTIGKEQNKITQNTESVARNIGAKPNDKSDGKEGESKGDKGDKNKSEPKDDSKGPKGDMKDPKAGDPKKDPNDKKDPAGDSKSKPSDSKDGSESKGKPKDGSDSAGEPKRGDQKPSDSKPSDPKDKKDSKPAESKAKPDNKADAKPGDSKDGKPSDQQSKPSDSKPSQGNPQQSQNKPNQNQQQNQNQQNQNQQQNQNPQSEQAKKQIQDAIENQKKAEDELKKPDRDKSAENVAKAIDDLEKLKKELEKRLRQLREEELERLLANLQSRCERMLAMQIAVYDGTKRVYGVVQTYADKKPTRAEEQASQKLSTDEGNIVKLANSTLQLLEAEGSAVAFFGALDGLRDDMVNVEKRLDKYDVSPFTQRIEEDIIAQLKEMIESLKKAQQDMKDKKNNPPPPSNGQPPPQKLLDLLAELKLLRSMQMQVNKRTKDYGATYEGEQAAETQVQGEIQQLSKRQTKIEEMLKNIATGKNQ
jgi:hypothetical protein